MQPNSITLPVDYLNNGTTTDETYTRFEEYQNRSVYIGENHSPDMRDTISLYRSFPTKNGNFKGVAKTSVKLSVDHTVPGVDGVAQLSAPIIWELSASIPVGVSVEDALKSRQRALAVLDLDAVMTPLNSQLMV